MRTACWRCSSGTGRRRCEEHGQGSKAADPGLEAPTQSGSDPKKAEPGSAPCVCASPLE
jgi:hypothetical protein